MGIGTDGKGCGRGARSGMERRTRWTVLGLALALGVALADSPATADWRIYTSGDLGYSVSRGQADGLIDFGTGTLKLGGRDTDVSPLLGGAVGLAIPMNEIGPLVLPRGWRLPEWKVRAEIEAVGLREYEFKTTRAGAGGGPTLTFLTEVKNWSLMSNFAVDLPLRGLYRPISWTSSRLFGRWRLHTLKRVLDIATFSPVAGVGVSHLDVTTNEADSRGTADEYNFAWQAGGDFGFQVADRVNVSVGYRYIDPGHAKYSLRGSALPARAPFKIDPEIHEARASLRIDVWDFATPWR